jgi:hypothetical protein
MAAALHFEPSLNRSINHHKATCNSNIHVTIAVGMNHHYHRLKPNRGFQSLSHHHHNHLCRDSSPSSPPSHSITSMASSPDHFNQTSATIQFTVTSIKRINHHQPDAVSFSASPSCTRAHTTSLLNCRFLLTRPSPLPSISRLQSPCAAPQDSSLHPVLDPSAAITTAAQPILVVASPRRADSPRPAKFAAAASPQTMRPAAAIPAEQNGRRNERRNQREEDGLGKKLDVK